MTLDQLTPPGGILIGLCPFCPFLGWRGQGLDGRTIGVPDLGLAQSPPEGAQCSHYGPGLCRHASGTEAQDAGGAESCSSSSPQVSDLDTALGEFPR